MKTLFFKTDSNGFNAANQATPPGTRKLLETGGADGDVQSSAAPSGFALGIFAAGDGGANGDFSMRMVVMFGATAAQKFRPRLARYDASGVLQAQWDGDLSHEKSSVPAGNTATWDWTLPGIDLGTWQAGDVLVAGVTIAAVPGGRRGGTNTYYMDGQSFVTVPWN